MDPVIIRTFEPSDIPAVVDLQQAYARVYPGAQVLPGELYLSPAFHTGKDVFCAYAGEQMAAYAPLYAQLIEAGPRDLPHRVWVEIKARPDLEDAAALKDLLFACLEERARALTGSLTGRVVKMIFQYTTGETASTAYVQSRGFAYTESIFTMLRDLRQAVPDSAAPEGITLRRWKMESEAEQRAYIQARCECFPEAPLTLEEWQYFLQSPMWAAGTAIAAFDGDQLAGCMSVYWDEADAGRSGDTEDIFVRPVYRGRGIARAMITDSLRYLREHGREQARLNVRALNENALELYRSLGYQVVNESRFYARDL